MVANKIKFDKNSQLKVRVVTERIVDEHGRTFLKTRWITPNKDMSLGSIAKPVDTGIVAIQWEDTTPRGNFFDNLRKGFE